MNASSKKTSFIMLFLAMALIGGAIMGIGSMTRAANRSSCGGSLAARSVCYARMQVGDPYVWGGKGPSSFDCSGLTYYAYRKAGLNWDYHTAAGQYQYGIAKKMAVSTSQLRPGDLLFFDWDGGGIDHVGIYAGNNR